MDGAGAQVSPCLGAPGTDQGRSWAGDPGPGGGEAAARPGRSRGRRRHLHAGEGARAPHPAGTSPGMDGVREQQEPPSVGHSLLLSAWHEKQPQSCQGVLVAEQC